MQTRQRIPTIFNIYMVDVLCCALGCVVFLWLINVNEARNQTEQAEKRAEESDKWRDLYALTKKENAQAKKDNAALLYAANKKDQENKDLETQLLAISKREKDALTKLSVVSKKEKNALTKLLAMTKSRDKEATIAKKNADDLKQSKISIDKLLLQMASMQFDLKSLNVKLKESETKIAIVGKKNEKWKSEYTLSQLLIKRLEQQLAAEATELKKTKVALKNEEKTKKIAIKSREELAARLKKLLDDLLNTQTNTQKLKLELALSKKQLDNLNTLLKLRDDSLTKTKVSYKELLIVLNQLNTRLKKANITIDQLHSAAKNRFAGIELTGERVLFMVDISGSMKKSNQYKDDPKKWPQVCDTFGKIMGSLVDLKQYQVILFSKQTRYLYPNSQAGAWLPYRGLESTKETVALLKKIDPVGPTNMYDAFAEAFNFRKSGMDTIYVISDGVPSEGKKLESPPMPADGQPKQLGQAWPYSQMVLKALKQEWNQPLWGKNRVRINTIGFFFDDPEVGSFLWALARENQGSFVGLNR